MDELASAMERLIDLEMAVSRTAQAVEKYLSEEVSDETTQETRGSDWQEAAGRLRTHIEAHDSAALDQLIALRNSLGGRVSKWEMFQRLEASLSAYDFEQARAHLDALVQWMGQTGKQTYSDS
jgi:hypothetical protein